MIMRGNITSLQFVQVSLIISRLAESVDDVNGVEQVSIHPRSYCPYNRNGKKSVIING